MLDLLILVAFQIIQVNQTTPCFLNETAGADIFKNCGFNEDYLSASLIGWEWITGGYFSLVLVALLVGIVYIKYHKAIYPLLIGILYLPIAVALLPPTWQSWVVILAIGGIISALIVIVIKQPKEYDG